MITECTRFAVMKLSIDAADTVVHVTQRTPALSMGPGCGAAWCVTSLVWTSARTQCEPRSVVKACG